MYFWRVLNATQIWEQVLYILILQISALRSCAKLLSSAATSDSSDQLKPSATADSESSVPLSRLDKSMYYGGSRAVFGKSLLRFVCFLCLQVLCVCVIFLFLNCYSHKSGLANLGCLHSIYHYNCTLSASLSHIVVCWTIFYESWTWDAKEWQRVIKLISGHLIDGSIAILHVNESGNSWSYGGSFVRCGIVSWIP